MVIMQKRAKVKINWNANIINTMLAFVLGAVLTIGLNWYSEFKSDKIKNGRALMLLAVEFEKIREAAPALHKSFENQFEIMISAKLIRPPFDIGSYSLLRQDLLSMKVSDYKVLHCFYSSVENFYLEYEKLLNANGSQEKVIYGMMVKEDLKNIIKQIESVEEVLIK